MSADRSRNTGQPWALVGGGRARYVLGLREGSRGVGGGPRLLSGTMDFSWDPTPIMTSPHAIDALSNGRGGARCVAHMDKNGRGGAGLSGSPPTPAAARCTG